MEALGLFTEKTGLLDRFEPAEIATRVRKVIGLVIEAGRLPVPVGSLCRIQTAQRGEVDVEVVGFREDSTLLMPLGEMHGVGPRDRVHCVSTEATVPAGDALLGRIIDGRGRPLDGRGPVLASGSAQLYGPGPHPLRRQRIDTALSTGVRAIDGVFTVGCGQRMGIFSGSGVGKSVLLGMIARHSVADVNVVALVGERGREVRDFIEKDLGEEGLKRSVVVVETSGRPALLRVRAAFAASAIADHFRSRGADVVLIMDSVTRLAIAQREIGLSVGEPPATKGYTPSVFMMLPKLLERAGRGEEGSVTGFYSVLVEGDDLTEPISDAVRGILDGHIWLSREIAAQGRYPAVDVLQSVSRVMVDVTGDEHRSAARELVACVAAYAQAEDLINIGAYVEGSNPQIDKAVALMPKINEFLSQAITGEGDLASARDGLLAIFGDATEGAAI